MFLVYKLVTTMSHACATLSFLYGTGQNRLQPALQVITIIRSTEQNFLVKGLIIIALQFRWGRGMNYIELKVGE